MSSRKSPSGPIASFTGFVALAATGVAATAVATATGTAQIAIGPAGTAFGLMNGLKMTTNDIVSVSPRVAPISSSSIVLSHARISSINTAGVAVVELTFGNPQTTGATTVANTWSINVDLQSADL